MTTITFLLIAPLFFFLTFGAMEGGRIFAAWLAITNEAREATRYGAVNFARTDVVLSDLVRDRIYQRLDGVLDQQGLYPEPDVVVTSAGERRVDVTIHYRVDLVSPGISAVLPDPFPMVARSSMRGE